MSTRAGNRPIYADGLGKRRKAGNRKCVFEPKLPSRYHYAHPGSFPGIGKRKTAPLDAITAFGLGGRERKNRDSASGMENILGLPYRARPNSRSREKGA